MITVLFSLLLVQVACSFQLGGPRRHNDVRSTGAFFSRRLILAAAEKNDKEGGGVEEYKNAATSFLSNFMQKDSMDEVPEDPLADIDFNAPKIAKTKNLSTLASVLDKELYEKEWFVTGKVNPSFFADDFEFNDPDVKLSGIEDYARGVYKLFDQETSRAEIISTVVNDDIPDTITVTWRLSGAVNIGPGLKIKPYICYTDFKVNENGLIALQEDRFDIPGWDILLSSLFPFLIGRVTSPPAPPVPPREDIAEKSKGKATSPLDSLFEAFKQ